MKPFDIQAVFAGKRVVDLNNERYDVDKVTIFGATEYFARKCDGSTGPIRMTNVMAGILATDDKLYIGGDKHIGWVNVYRDPTGVYNLGKKLHPDADTAKSLAGESAILQLKVEFED